MKTFIKPVYFFSFSILLSAVLTGCDPSQKHKLEALMEKRDSLLQVNSTKDTLIHSLSLSFGEIENNLELIRKKEGMLRVHAGQSEDVTDKRQEINHNINEINDLMTRNANRIHSLNAQLKRTRLDNAGLSRMIAVLADHVMLKNVELIGLSKLLSKKDKQITALGNTTLSLAGEIKSQGDIIDMDQQELNFKDQELNRAFFFIGNTKELKSKRLLNAHGELVSSFDQNIFTPIDARQVDYIPWNKLSERSLVRVLTLHPTGSYEFVKNDQGKNVNLKINDRKEFWRISRYLILETN